MSTLREQLGDEFWGMIWWAILAINIFVLALNLYDLWHVHTDPYAGYPWGSENAGLRYRSPEIYQRRTTIDVILLTSGVAFPFVIRRKLLRCAIGILPLLVILLAPLDMI